ncbi:hypothetical protein [Tateyamaria sp.]|uniref:hypothetical protein n=1 Tax=Tateyamaria sp. TaxID=1929288 RepID=UPI00329FA127
MRSLMITASLCIAASAASAGPNYLDGNSNMTLSNGCVYTPSPAGTANTWALIYASTGPAASCAFQVYTQPTFVSRAEASSLTFTRTASIAVEPEYLVGVFR